MCLRRLELSALFGLAKVATRILFTLSFMPNAGALFEEIRIVTTLPIMEISPSRAMDTLSVSLAPIKRYCGYIALNGFARNCFTRQKSLCSHPRLVSVGYSGFIFVTWRNALTKSGLSQLRLRWPTVKPQFMKLSR